MADENTNSQRITSLENRVERQTLPPRESERKAPMQGDESRRRVEIPRQEQPKEPPREQPKEKSEGNVYVTKVEVQAAIDGLMGRIAALVATKGELDNLNMAIASVARNVDANFATKDQAKQIAKDAVPMTIRDIDSSKSERSGNVAMLSQGGSSGTDKIYFGTVSAAGLTLGDKVFFGHKVNPNGDDPDLVRIYAGEIDGIAVAQTDVTVVDNYFIYVARLRSDNTMTITSDESVPDDDATYFYYKLYQFSVTDGVAKVLKYCRPFAIEGGKIPSNASKSKYMVMCLSADVGAINDPSKITWDWLRMGSLP
jgi:hypothetical protein